MKNFTKFFCAAALCLAGAMSANAATEYEPDEVFTSLEAGKSYAITMEGKALYGSSAQNLAFDEFKKAFVETNSGYLFKLESLADDADEEVRAYYRLRLITPTGSEYSIWGSPGYLNSQPATQSCSFILGLNGQNGQDGKNLAVWDIQYVDGKGFTMKNIGTGLYLNDAAPAKYEDPAYWTFCTLKEKVDADPLASQKEALNEKITLAKFIPSVAKTAESFATLTAAIEAAEAALTAADATAESLEAALANLNAAIEGLELAEGYSNLTKEDYNNPYGAYVLYESTGLPYGDGNVDMNNYADLSDYDQLIVTVADGTPRFCFNRTTATGNDNADESLSEMIDINANNSDITWCKDKYQTVDGKTYTINVKKITEDKGNAYLHCIKGANWANVTVTGMYLYKGTATGINNVNAAAQSANVYYDLQGRRVANPANGLYIVNGKKVVVK